MTLRQAQGERRIGVVGAGAWGTALAQVLASDGSNVVLWAREPELVDEINAHRTNSLFLPSAKLASSIAATNHIRDLPAVGLGSSARVAVTTSPLLYRGSLADAGVFNGESISSLTTSNRPYPTAVLAPAPSH